MPGLTINKVLLLDGVSPVCAEILKAANIAVTVKGKRTEAELLDDVKEFDAIVVRSATKVTAPVFRARGRLQLVGRAGAGTDNIDVVAASEAGVVVMNTPGGNTVSAAEHACALLLSLGRFLPQACESLKAGRWDRKLYLGNELSGKTLAVVGLGRIGKEVAKRMKSFDMKILGYDPFVSKEDAAALGIESLELEEIWPRADYITLHTPLLPHTRNLINDEVLSKCRRGVKVVNAARGGIVDEAALLRALEDGRCGGAGLDVFLTEPPTETALCRHPKVVCTPHLGANTTEAQTRVAEEMAEQIVAAGAGQALAGLVNAHVLAGGELFRPWLALGRALGLVARGRLGGAAGGDGVAVAVGHMGSLITPSARSLLTAVFSGLVGEKNLITAKNFGKSEIKPRGAVHHMAHKFPVTDLLEVTVSCGVQSVTLMGTVAVGRPLLLAMDGSMWRYGVPLGEKFSLRQLATGEKVPGEEMFTSTCVDGYSFIVERGEVYDNVF